MTADVEVKRVHGLCLPLRRPARTLATRSIAARIAGGGIAAEQFTVEAEAVAHRADRVGAVGGQATPAPAVPPVEDDVEGRRAGSPQRVGRAIVVEGAPAEPALADPSHGGLGREFGEEVERRDMDVDPARG